ncbi:MAG: polysaccharide deacetylase family protein [Deferrisomatales bacterium]|nr:polysaccharide deacetylase family protein [Deferrisomatales bacterium]
MIRPSPTVSLPVLAYHAVGPGERLDPARFVQHAQAIQNAGLPILASADLERAERGALITLDDGFADLWTHGLSVLAAHDLRALVFVIPPRCGDGSPRPKGVCAWSGGQRRAHAEAARSGEAHPAFLRWSELEALEASGRVEVQSHGQSHAMGWVDDEIIGFHLGSLGRTHWSLPQSTGGDERLGIPLYRRGSTLAHRLYADNKYLRDYLARWLEERGGEAYVAERGAKAVSRELQVVVKVYRGRQRLAGTWESDAARVRRTVEDLVSARETLERRLGGCRDQLALPWGQYDQVTLECARQAGLRRVYTLDRAPNLAGRIGLLVHRFEPRPRGARWLRLRLWIYQSAWRACLYGRLSGRMRGAV